MSSTPAPLRLRPTVGTAIGTTAFFRNRLLFDTLLDVFAESGLKRIDLLFHACSIGAEVNSLVMQYLLRGLDRQFDLHCWATDLQPDFLALARQGDYPLEILNGCSEAEQRCFERLATALRPVAAVRERITWLAPSDFTRFQPERRYDAVCLLNALVYVPAERQAAVIDAIAGYGGRWLVTTGFHQESIKADLQRNHYEPVLRNVEAIHNGWTDRLRAQAISAAELPPHIHTDWSLRPFSPVPDYEYRYCALFQRPLA